MDLRIKQFSFSWNSDPSFQEKLFSERFIEAPKGSLFPNWISRDADSNVSSTFCIAQIAGLAQDILEFQHWDHQESSSILTINDLFKFINIIYK